MDKFILYTETHPTTYKLAQNYVTQTILRPPEDIVTDFARLTTEGVLTVIFRYAWDGASGPTRDTKSAMRGPLAHDTLYQMMRMGLLDYKLFRKPADQQLYLDLREDGMNYVRAKYWYAGVRTFAEKYARPQSQEIEIKRAP